AQTALVPFSEFMAQVHADKDKDAHVESVSIKDREYSFVVKDPKNGTQAKKITIGPDKDGEIAKVLDDAKVRVTFEKEEGSPFWSGASVTILPTVFLLLMFYSCIRELQAGGGKAMSFGKTRARLLNEAQNKVTFADVAGIDEAKDELEELRPFHTHT